MQSVVDISNDHNRFAEQTNENLQILLLEATLI